MSWLLRKHWERYLLGFQEDGLVLEGTRKYRAYFEGRVKPTGPSFGTVRNGGATAARLSRSAATDHALGSKLRASAMRRPEEHTSELQSLMRRSYAVIC